MGWKCLQSIATDIWQRSQAVRSHFSNSRVARQRHKDSNESKTRRYTRENPQRCPRGPWTELSGTPPDSPCLPATSRMRCNSAKHPGDLQYIYCFSPSPVLCFLFFTHCPVQGAKSRRLSVYMHTRKFCTLRYVCKE